MPQSMVTKKSYTNDYKDVLLNKDLAHEIGVQVSNTGVSNNAEGRKIIPAGTPLGGSVDPLITRNTVLSVTNSSSNGANAKGILRYPVDVTNGNATATLIVAGVVDVSKCPSIDNTVKTALTHIIFQDGGAE